jgi:ABC-type multidrug transport system ATPase subunit
MSRNPRNPRNAPALVTTGLSKNYGDRPALEPLDLEVPVGEHVALVGHNGSGKTTLLKMAAGLLDPSDGAVKICGHASGTEGARRSLSWLSDSPTFYDDLSLWEHLEYIARLHGVDEWEERAEELLERLGLSARADDPPGGFSKGMRQKASIALAFVRPFGLLLADEPFDGLDPPSRDALAELVAEAGAGGAAVVLATHHLDVVTQASRCVAIDDGLCVYDGPADAPEVARLVAR